MKSRSWHVGTYESVGFCAPSQEHPYPAQYSSAWVGYDDPDVPADFIDFFGPFVDNPKRTGHSPRTDPWLFGGDPDDPNLVGTCHGIRVKQLDRSPPGLDIGGEAWIRLTIGSLSATQRVEANGLLVPTPDGNGYWIEANSPGDPLDTTTATPGSGFMGDRRDSTHFIESIALVATNDNMSQWIIAFNEPGTYAYTAGYWGLDNNQYGININFLRL